MRTMQGKVSKSGEIKMNRTLKLPLFILALMLSACQNKPLPVQAGSADVTKTSNETCDPQFPLPPKCLEKKSDKKSEKEEGPEMDTEPVYANNDSMELQVTPFPHELPAETEAELTLTFTATKDTEGRDIEISFDDEVVLVKDIDTSTCDYFTNLTDSSKGNWTQYKIYLDEIEKEDKCEFTLKVTAAEDFFLIVKSCKSTENQCVAQFRTKTHQRSLPDIMVTP